MIDQIGSISDEDMTELLKKYDQMSNSLSNIRAKEAFLLECKSAFHSNHFIPFAVKFSLCMVRVRNQKLLQTHLNIRIDING
jgi:lysine/ornithine N-monooxygenase